MHDAGGCPTEVLDCGLSDWQTTVWVLKVLCQAE